MAEEIVINLPFRQNTERKIIFCFSDDFYLNKQNIKIEPNDQALTKLKQGRSFGGEQLGRVGYMLNSDGWKFIPRSLDRARQTS